MFTHEGWEYDGPYFKFPLRNVLPKPVQKPHPPLWVACSRRETIRLAAERGIGALSFSFVEPEEAAEWVAEYRAIIASERCLPAGFAVNPRVAVVLPMMCHADEAEAIERGIDGAHFFGYSLAHYYVFGDHRPGRTNIYEEFLRRRDEVGFARSVVRPEDAPLGVRVLQQGLGSLRGAIGTPEQIRDLCRRYEAAGVDQVICVLQAGRNRHDHICESLELFGAEVLPEFAAGADAADARRDAELADAIDAALLRRAPPRVADRDYTIAPTASGPPAPATSVDGHRPLPRPRLASLQKLAKDGGEQAFQAFVRRASDARLERTVGSPRGLKLIFAAMTQAYDPEAAGGVAGDIQYDLSRSDGRRARWTVGIDAHEATAREGPAAAPLLTLKLSVADFLRIAAGDLDPGKALLTGRLDLEGDFALVQRLGEMFGRAAAL